MITQMRKKIYKETTDLLNHAIVSYQCFLSYLLHGTRVHSHKHLLIDLKNDIHSYILSRSNGKKTTGNIPILEIKKSENKKLLS